MPFPKDSNFNEKEKFILFLSNCDDIAFDKAIEYINIKGFFEGMFDHLFFDDKNTLIEAMEFANSSYTLVKDYLEAKYNVKIY